MQLQIRFCSAADGVRLAYAVHGRGPVIVKAAHWLTHLEHDWRSRNHVLLGDEPAFAAFLDHMNDFLGSTSKPPAPVGDELSARELQVLRLGSAGCRK